MKPSGAIRISGVGTTTTTSGTSSAAIAIPNDSSATRARFVYVVADTAAAIKFGPSGVGAATVNDIVVTSRGVILDVGGHTHYRVIEVTAGAKINVSPVDN